MNANVLITPIMKDLECGFCTARDHGKFFRIESTNQNRRSVIQICEKCLCELVSLVPDDVLL